MDALSFLIALTLILTLSSVALVGNWLQRRRVPGLLMMALGSFPITGGALLFVLQNFQLPSLITVFAANSMLLGGRLIQLFGLAAFWRQTESRSTTFSALAYLPAVVGFGYFTLIESTPQWSPNGLSWRSPIEMRSTGPMSGMTLLVCSVCPATPATSSSSRLDHLPDLPRSLK